MLEHHVRHTIIACRCPRSVLDQFRLRERTLRAAVADHKHQIHSKCNPHIRKWFLNSFLVYQLIHEMRERETSSVCSSLKAATKSANCTIKLIFEAYIKVAYVDLNEIWFSCQYLLWSKHIQFAQAAESWWNKCEADVPMQWQTDRWLVENFQFEIYMTALIPSENY